METKKKDKKSDKLKGYDSRGVQTLFRTLSRNHYTLLRNVDNKASIILTINSIIISLQMGSIYMAPEEMQHILLGSTRLLINFSLVSMIFAMISMLPHKYLRFSLRDSKYNGSLYAGNFANLSLEEFQSEINRIISSGETVYNEMTMDLYYLGKTISGKQKMLLLSAIIFIIGITITLISFAKQGLYS